MTPKRRLKRLRCSNGIHASAFLEISPHHGHNELTERVASLGSKRSNHNSGSWTRLHSKHKAGKKGWNGGKRRRCGGGVRALGGGGRLGMAFGETGGGQRGNGGYGDGDGSAVAGGGSVRREAGVGDGEEAADAADALALLQAQVQATAPTVRPHVTGYHVPPALQRQIKAAESAATSSAVQMRLGRLRQRRSTGGIGKVSPRCAFFGGWTSGRIARRPVRGRG